MAGEMNRRWTRREVVGALAAPAGGWALAACGGLGGTGRTGGPDAGAGGTLLKQPATIEVVHPFTPTNPDADGRYMPTLLSRVGEFSPNLKVQSSETAGNVPEKVITMVAAGTPPDVSTAYVLQGTTLAARKVAAPLAPLLKAAKDWSAADYFDGAREAFTYDGELLFAPFLLSPMAITVNLDMVDRAGLKPPAASWTWDTFTDYAVKLTQRSGSETKVYGAGFPYTPNTNMTEMFGSLLWSHGGDWINRQTRALTFHRAEGVAALETWVNLTLRQGAVPAVEPEAWKPFGPRPATRGGLAVANGLAAMAYAYSAGVLEYQGVVPPALKWTTVPMPRRKQGGAHFYACSWYVPAGAKNRAGAVEFVRVASLPELVAQWNIASFTMATRKAATSRPEWDQHLKRQPLLAAFGEEVPYARTYPAVVGWGDVMQGEGGVGPALYAACQGKAAPKAALEDSARVAEGILAQLGQTK